MLTKLAHAVEHFFNGICICPCSNCTVHVIIGTGTGKRDLVKCVCQDCPRELCGARNGI